MVHVCLHISSQSEIHSDVQPALKEKADYVTDTNVNDGIKKACEHFGWI